MRNTQPPAATFFCISTPGAVPRHCAARRNAAQVLSWHDAVVSAPNDSLVGNTLANRYILESRIADELLGRVFVARDQVDDRLVNIKVLHPHLVDDAEKFARFGREFTATRMVKHPNTVAVTDWGQHEGLHYLVFDYVLSHTVQEEIDEEPMSSRRAAQVAIQVARRPSHREANSATASTERVA